MSYTIGTDDYYSTWGSLRGILFQNNVSGFFFPPTGFHFTPHNKEFPPTSGEQGYNPAYLTPESGTLMRSGSYFSPFIDWNQEYQPGPIPYFWTGRIIITMESKDFDYMIGKTASSPNASTTIAEEAREFPGQLLDPEQDWWPGFFSVEEFKFVT